MDTKQNKYLIYAFTYWCATTQFFVGLILPTFIILNFGPLINLPITIISYLLFNVIVWYFVRKYLLQPIEITLIEDRIILKYLNNNLTETKKEVSTTIEKLSRFSDFSDGRDLKFKLYFSQGQTFTLYKSGLWNRKDDFELLLYDFKIYLEDFNDKSINENRKAENKKIKYGDSTYLNFAIISFSFSFFMGLFLIIENNETFNYKGLFGFLILLAFGVFNLYRHRNANEKINEE